MLDQQTIEELLREAQNNLAGWREPDASGVSRGGYLVPTEPDPEQRARIRHGLLVQIFTLEKVLGRNPDSVKLEAATHREWQRLRDAVIDAERPGREELL